MAGIRGIDMTREERFLDGDSLETTGTAAGLELLEVYNPSGHSEVNKPHAPRLEDLHGKTICEISNAGWEAHRTFPLIRGLLQRQFPSVKIIPYTEVVGSRRQCEDLAYVAKMVKQKGCQAIIAGNAS